MSLYLLQSVEDVIFQTLTTTLFNKPHILKSLYFPLPLPCSHHMVVAGDLTSPCPMFFSTSLSLLQWGSEAFHLFPFQYTEDVYAAKWCRSQTQLCICICLFSSFPSLHMLFEGVSMDLASLLWTLISWPDLEKNIYSFLLPSKDVFAVKK